MKSHCMKIDITKEEVTISRYGKKKKIPLINELYPLFSIKEDKEAKNLKHLTEEHQEIIHNVLKKTMQFLQKNLTN